MRFKGGDDVFIIEGNELRSAMVVNTRPSEAIVCVIVSGDDHRVDRESEWFKESDVYASRKEAVAAYGARAADAGSEVKNGQ